MLIQYGYSVLAHSLFVFSVTLVFSLVVYALRSHIHKLKRFESEIVNFIGGFVYAYVFFTLMPEIFDGNEHQSMQLFFQILLAFIGYMIFYLAEKRIFDHRVKGRPIARKLLKVRTDGFFVLHFLLGFVILFSIQTQNVFGAIITLVPVGLHILLTSFLYEDLHKWMNESVKSQRLAPILIMCGTVTALFTTFLFEVPILLFFSFFAGTFLYLTTTLLRPQYHHKYLAYFILGSVIYIFLLVLNIAY